MCGCLYWAKFQVSLAGTIILASFASVVGKEERTTHRSMYITLNLERKIKIKVIQRNVRRFANLWRDFSHQQITSCRCWEELIDWTNFYEAIIPTDDTHSILINNLPCLCRCVYVRQSWIMPRWFRMINDFTSQENTRFTCVSGKFSFLFCCWKTSVELWWKFNGKMFFERALRRAFDLFSRCLGFESLNDFLRFLTNKMLAYECKKPSRIFLKIVEQKLFEV